MELSCIYQLPDENINEIENYFLSDYQQLRNFVEKNFQNPLSFWIAGWYKTKGGFVIPKYEIGKQAPLIFLCKPLSLG